MNYRDIEIFAPSDLGASGTEVIDLKMSNKLSTIELIWRTTVVTVSDMTDVHVACISRIEIADGSNVLWSISGEEAQALYFYNTGKMPLNDISVDTTEYCRSVIPLMFGRYLWDPQLALDPARYANLQLKITWDEDKAGASVVANQLTVRGWAFDQKAISPQGFLAAKEIKSWTPVASSYEYTDLPTDFPIRSLLYRQAATDKNPFEVCDQIKLSEDFDERVPFDLTGQEVFDKIVHEYGRISQKVELNETAGDAMALYLAPTYLHHAAVDYDDEVVAADDEHIQAAFAGNIVTIGATVNKVPHSAEVSGYAPHFCMPIPLGRQDVIEDWFNPRNLSQLRLTTKGASAVGTTPEAAVVVQQHRT